MMTTKMAVFSYLFGLVVFFWTRGVFLDSWCCATYVWVDMYGWSGNVSSDRESI
jgi:hypothetical protein